MIQESLLITKREAEVINKKMKNKRLTQQDSNYLSRYVRPKLKEMSQLDSRLLLKKIEYNQKIPSIENKIINIILEKVKQVTSINLYGSIIYNNYENYKDIDVLILVKEKFWKKLSEKYKTILEIKEIAKKHHLNLDIEIYEARSLINPNISLTYHLKDSKTIYGILKLSKTIKISKTDLKAKIANSIIEEKDPDSEEIYKAIRNIWLIRLTMNKIIDNTKLNKILEDELGKNTIAELKSGKADISKKKITLIYLKNILNQTLRELNDAKWEKIVLKNPWGNA